MAELIYPDAGQWIDALQAGQKAGMTARRTAAAETAGGLMTGGDFKGAAAQMYGAGDFAGGSAIAQAGYAQTENSMKLDRQKAVQQKLAAGDFAGAYAAAGPDKDLLDGLDKVAGHAKETTATLASALQALKDPQTGQWFPPEVAQQRYTEMKPTLAARGIDPKMLDSFVPTPTNLDAIQAQVAGLDKQLEMHKPVVVGKSLVDPASGREVFKDKEVRSVKNADGSDSLVELGGDAPGAPAASRDGAGPAPVAEAPVPTGGVYSQIGQVAAQHGATPAEIAFLQRNAQVESHGNPNVRPNGSSTGLFQFHPDTFTAMGGGNINDIGDQTRAALALQRRDRHALAASGLEPSDANVYIMHQQGPGGGPALLTAPPDMNAVQALLPAYKGNEHMARSAIVGNGGNPDMTAGLFVDMWRQRWANGGAPVKAQAPAQGQPAAAQGGAAGAHVIFRGEGMDETSQLDQNDVHLLASRYLIDGSLPPLGMGKPAAAMKQKILHEAGTIATSMGIDAGDLVAGTASTKALSHALSKNMDMQQAVQQFEQTAIKNADLALSLAPKGGAQLNVPILDRWVQTGRKAVLGDPAVTQFDVALGTFLDEYAKVTTGATGGTGSTDSARKEAYERLSKYASQGQLSAGISTMKQEMGNRSQALKEVESGIRTRLRTGGAPLAPATDTGAAPKPDASQPQGGLTAAQAKTRAAFTNNKAQAGSNENPFVPSNEAQYNKLPRGAHYIAPDGSVKVKG